MLIVRLKGGLGNQMFQYAFAKRLSIELDKMLTIDNVTGFKTDFYKREYDLHKFGIQNNFIYNNSIKILSKMVTDRKVGNILRYYVNNILKNIYILKEEDGYIGQFKDLSDYSLLYIDGYWQNYEFFMPFNNRISKDFSVKSSFLEQHKEIVYKILKSNSVSIHVRRLHGVSTDGYINKFGRNFHGTIPYGYYKEAINIINNRIGDLHLFFFSDDIDWVKENMKFHCKTEYISGYQDYEELWLMSLCKYNVVANSSFSWWGAWLNSYQNKMVIAPKKWYNNRIMNLKTNNLIPDNWVRL